MVDSNGDLCHCFPRVAVWSADYPEQCLLVGLAGNQSPQFIAGYDKLEDEDPGELRTKDSVLNMMKELRVIYDEDEADSIVACLAAAGECGLNGVLEPWWEDHIDFQPWRTITPDILHGLHRFFRDHPLKWVRKLVGHAEYDRRLSALQPLIGVCHFPDGISHLKQITGKEDRDLQRTVVAISAGAPKMTGNCLRATRAILDLIYILQYESHDDQTFAYIDEFHHEFHTHKVGFLDAGVRTMKNGERHMKIPKLYGLHSYKPSIRALGSSPQWSTEHGERAHIPLAKDLYRGTNRREFGLQMC